MRQFFSGRIHATMAISRAMIVHSEYQGRSDRYHEVPNEEVICGCAECRYMIIRQTRCLMNQIGVELVNTLKSLPFSSKI